MTQKLKVYFSHSRDPNFDYLSMYSFLGSNFVDIEWFFPHQKSQDPAPIKEMLLAKRIDLVLAEVSYPSHGQGIELGYADMLSVQIVCIHLSDQKISGSISAISQSILQYKDLDELKEIITEQITIFNLFDRC
jgi:hypothetical protein